MASPFVTSVTVCCMSPGCLHNFIIPWTCIMSPMSTLHNCSPVTHFLSLHCVSLLSKQYCTSAPACIGNKVRRLHELKKTVLVWVRGRGVNCSSSGFVETGVVVLFVGLGKFHHTVVSIIRASWRKGVQATVVLRTRQQAWEHPVDRWADCRHTSTYDADVQFCR